MRGGARAHTNVDREVASPTSLRGSDDVGLFAQDEPTLFLVDGNNLLWRAAHATPAPFRAKDGRDLTPLFRFITKLRHALGSYGLFAECVVCFDGVEAWGNRQDVDASYKANRDYESKDLSFMGWLPEIRAALEGAGVVVIEVDDSEADDVIGTLTHRARNRPVRILSTDRDYYQLVGPDVCVINPKERPQLVTAACVEARYAVTPAQWCDFRALCGDPSDGIGGIPGIGMKRAAALLHGGARLEDIKDAVADHWDDVLRWRELIRLRTDLAIDPPNGRSTPRLPAAATVCAELGLA